MKHTYKITGMTCNGCRTTVEEKLNGMEQVVRATVNLEKETAEIEMKSHIPIIELQETLIKAGKYTIESLDGNAHSNKTFEVETTSELKQLFPLFLIFAYITVAAILLNIKPMFSSSNFMLDFMGLFYIVFSFFKLLDLKGFPDSFRMYDPLAKAIPGYAWVYPFIELGLGLLFLMRIQIPFALIMTIIILGITTVGVIKILFDKKSIQCACLGTALKLPMTKATFIENTIMLIMAIIMLLNS